MAAVGADQRGLAVYAQAPELLSAARQIVSALETREL
jgi:hypothetical protein